jgi:TctA family transporter
MLAVLHERNQNGLPDQSESRTVDARIELGLLGTITGMVTGFFAGLGAGSLVTFFGNQAETDEEYLLMTSASEAANDLMALMLVLVAGMGRSGEAVLLGRTINAPSFGQACLVMVMVALAAMVGRAACFKLEKGYTTLVALVPARLMAVLVIGLAVWQVSLVGHPLLAGSLTLAGVCLSLWARSCKLPLQVSFAGIALPLVVQGLGFAPNLSHFLYGA